MDFVQANLDVLLRHLLPVVFFAFLVEAAGVPFPSRLVLLVAATLADEPRQLVGLVAVSTTRAGGFSERVVPLSGEARGRGSEALGVIDRAIAAGFLPPAPRARACGICDFRDVCGPHEEVRVKLKEQARMDELRALRDWP